ncbi:26S proteasome non-ATPase regulatory subunit 9 [Tetrabaena socialis]|uniref:26S proteasome non-ATPase regulatory subunit 9 n=1 Tax=Tetrabaena socialis TaxID=47790 RepID=A0A2J8ADI3_9CHLO|nr:26S proteasome non-ATPase regulatory subunit 9 [Tetrabaena socialis]|eukprot:PNH10580.1 26S proteasome non-ATPase regulatory subunit 9 [Tetrabaena socialis]
MCTATSQSSVGRGPSAEGAENVVDVLRRDLRELDRQRQGAEQEISAISERLNAPGQPGLKGSLLDKEGFPRADIDVHQVRRDRNRLVCLTNDHKAMTDRLARLLAEVHAASRADGSPAGAVASTTSGNASAASQTNSDADGTRPGAVAADGPAGSSGNEAFIALVPFAMVDEVSSGSPAAAAGLQVGDLLCDFGGVAVERAVGAPAAEAASGSSGPLMQRVAAVLAAREGQPVAATLLRQGAPVSASLTPQRWSGRGLLGCHLSPL